MGGRKILTEQNVINMLLASTSEEAETPRENKIVTADWIYTIT